MVVWFVFFCGKFDKCKLQMKTLMTQNKIPAFYIICKRKLQYLQKLQYFWKNCFFMVIKVVKVS